jgi:hypothetical protein
VEIMSDASQFDELDLREEPSPPARTESKEYSNVPTCRTTPCTATQTIGCCA